MIGFIWFLGIVFNVYSSTLWKDLDLQNGCSLFHYGSEKRVVYPGRFCLFLQDDTFISAEGNVLQRIGQKGEVLWKIPADIRAPMTLSFDKTRILTIGNEIVRKEKRSFRSDKVLILSLEGKEISSRSAEDIFAEAKITPLNKKLLKPTQKFLGVETEISQLNSVYEIPRQTRSSHPSFQAGNILVNGLETGFIIMSPDLKKVIFSIRYYESRNHTVHDAQVTPQGEFLFFNNEVIDPFVEQPYSTAVAWNMVTRRRRFSLGGSPGGIFYSPTNGSVQILSDGTVLFTHMISGGYFMDEAGNLKGSFFGNFGNRNFVAPIREVKARDLKEFRKNYQGPTLEGQNAGQ